jgi:hypothetical protein
MPDKAVDYAFQQLDTLCLRRSAEGLERSPRCVDRYVHILGTGQHDRRNRFLGSWID